MRALTLLLLAATVLAPGGRALHAQRPAGSSDVPPERSLCGVVRDPEGRRVAGAIIRPGGLRSVVSDSIGDFCLPPAERRTLLVMVSHPAFEPLSIEVDPPKSDTSRIDLILFPRAGAAYAASRVPEAPDSATPPAPGVAPRAVMRAGTGRIVGRVLDTTGTPLVRADVDLRPRPSTVQPFTVGPGGAFELSAVPAGPVLLVVRRIGYEPVSVPVTVPDGGTVEAEIRLVALGQRLARVDVRSDRTRGRIVEFEERRRANAGGQYFVREEFIARGPVRLSDIIQRANGLRILNDATGRRRAYGRAQCEMMLVVDGVPQVLRSGDSIDDFVSVNDIEGVEVYTRTAGLPGSLLAVTTQFGGPNTCGVIAAWTRIGNDRQPRR